MAANSKSSKAHAQRTHAKRRAFERYGFVLNRHDLGAIANQIRSGKAEFIWKQSARVAHYAVMVQDQRAIVVYDRTRKTVVTFLPLEAEFTHAEQQIGRHGRLVQDTAQPMDLDFRTRGRGRSEVVEDARFRMPTQAFHDDRQSPAEAGRLSGL